MRFNKNVEKSLQLRQCFESPSDCLTNLPSQENVKHLQMLFSDISRTFVQSISVRCSKLNDNFSKCVFELRTTFTDVPRKAQEHDIMINM